MLATGAGLSAKPNCFSGKSSFPGFSKTLDLKGDINIPDLDKTLSNDADVAGTQNVLVVSRC